MDHRPEEVNKPNVYIRISLILHFSLTHFLWNPSPCVLKLRILSWSTCLFSHSTWIYGLSCFPTLWMCLHCVHIQESCTSWMHSIFRVPSPFIPFKSKFFSLLELKSYASKLSDCICENVCDAISTSIYELKQTNAMLIKESLHICCCCENNRFNPPGAECKMVLISLHIIP